MLMMTMVVAAAALSLAATTMLTTVDAAMVEETWTVRAWRTTVPRSPDCFTDRDVLLVNEMNPGPVLRANVGDTVRVTITNEDWDESLRTLEEVEQDLSN